MLTILKPGYLKIMQLYYHDKTMKLHLREIARRTKLHEPSTYRFLNSLEEEKILLSVKEGNLKKYFVRHNIRAHYIFQAFDLDRFERLPSIRSKAIKTYLDNLNHKPVFAVLFGSTAKGTYNKESDIDLLIIMNDNISLVNAQKEANALTGIKISTFQMTYNDFMVELKMKEDKMVQSALNTGYPLLNHIEYYEALYNERI